MPEGAGEVILANCTNVLVENQKLNSGSIGIEIAYSSNITITNNTINSNNYRGIYLDSSSNNTISNNNVSNSWNGIYLLHGSSNNIITNNNVSNNYLGIILESSSNNTLSNNNVNSNNWKGIILESSSNNLLTNNTMIEDSISIFGYLLEHYTTNEIDSTNTVNGKPVYFWKNKVGGKVPEGTGEVILANCTNVLVENQKLNNGTIGLEIAYSSSITVINNTASNNYHGIYLWDSSNNTISNNNVSNNEFGIYLRDSSSNTISNNNVSNNEFGIYLLDSSNNTISNNTANSNNRFGIYLYYYSSNNKIYLNNFIKNTDNVYSESSTNIWNSTEKITYTYKGNQYTNYLGNYWDNYTGSDADKDGIGDTAYSINGDKDNYPLMEPFENYIRIPKKTAIFDTGAPANPYPSIMGNHTGTIKPNHTVIATKLYTYPCAGTGGHTEYARIWNLTWNATATWEGYAGDWHNISFDKTVVLLANKTYNYTIRTGSYPQIHHTDALPTENGWINCTKFTDANGKVYYDWIPAIRLRT